jgi:ABC-type dipeptide/oligopeptide/nickel transport system permease component
MLGLTLRTLLRMVVSFLAIVTLVFLATRLSGDPLDSIGAQGLTKEDRELLTRYYGLDRGMWEQYWAFLRAFTDGQFGLSFVERRPVAQIVVERLWPTGQLILAAMAVTLVLAIPMGLIAAIWRDRWPGHLAMGLAFFGYAVPNFVLATFLVLVFAYWLNWLPVVGNGSALHFVMPVAVLSAGLIAALSRFTRNAMLDVLGQDYMRTARAKGLPERLVILRHGLRNAGITILSVVGLQIAGLAASGSVVVEAIFSWPGVGDLLVNAALRRDYPVLQFGVVVVSVAVLAISALTDLAYAWVDPRLRRATQWGAG